MADLIERLRRWPTPLHLEAAAALEAAREDGWQPIETAPHVELAEVLLFNGSEVCAGGWWEGRWTTAHDEIEPQPTHWRPLPAPPAIDQARGKGGAE